MTKAIRSLIAVLGPTASGKSDMAVRLALALDGEVISGDSMQIYQGLNIGTAKITEAEKHGIPHHLIDLRGPAESFSAAEYQELARRTAADILRRGRTPVLAGGTGLYLDSALYNYEYNIEKDEGNGAGAGSFREALLAETEAKSPEELLLLLSQVDPVSAAQLHPNDRKRILRALEYARIHGRPISLNRAARDLPGLIFPGILIGLNLPRALLYSRINARVERMMQAGLLAETAALAGGGLSPRSRAGQAIGYKQLLQYLDGACSLAEAVEGIKRESRHYAKRQLTWFRRNPDILWLDAQKALEGDWPERVADFLRKLPAAREGRELSIRDPAVFAAIKVFFRDAGLLFPVEEEAQ